MPYAPLPDSQIDADSALIADTLFKLRDNPEAVFDADSTARKISPYAIDAGTIGIVDYTIGSGEISLSLNHGYSTSKNVILLVNYEGTTLNDVRLRRNGSNLYFYDGSSSHVHLISVGTGTTTFQLIRNSGTFTSSSIIALVLS